MNKNILLLFMITICQEITFSIATARLHAITMTTYASVILTLLYIIIIIIIIISLLTRGQSNLTKSASRGAIPRLGVTPGGRKLYH